VPAEQSPGVIARYLGSREQLLGLELDGPRHRVDHPAEPAEMLDQALIGDALRSVAAGLPWFHLR
jgi:hypothetical protein